MQTKIRRLAGEEGPAEQKAENGGIQCGEEDEDGQDTREEQASPAHFTEREEGRVGATGGCADVSWGGSCRCRGRPAGLDDRRSGRSGSRATGGAAVPRASPRSDPGRRRARTSCPRTSPQPRPSAAFALGPAFAALQVVSQPPPRGLPASARSSQGSCPNQTPQQPQQPGLPLRRAGPLAAFPPALRRALLARAAHSSSSSPRPPESAPPPRRPAVALAPQAPRPALATFPALLREPLARALQTFPALLREPRPLASLRRPRRGRFAGAVGRRREFCSANDQCGPRRRRAARFSGPARSSKKRSPAPSPPSPSATCACRVGSTPRRPRSLK
mmetsp:Transcript_21130/g.65206  ORF Transcript_21130/g.65206 Transcript_21130/m.65206 type:complete len:332 (+) Transcript_21130:47-1042(+)